MFSLSFTIQLSYFWAVGGLPAEESKRGDPVVSVVFSYVKWKHYFFKICFYQKYEKSNTTDGTYSHCLGPPLLVLPPLRSWHSLPLLCSGLSWANPENWCATVSLHSYLTLFCIFIHEHIVLIFYFDLIMLQFWVTQGWLCWLGLSPLTRPFDFAMQKTDWWYTLTCQFIRFT